MGWLVVASALFVAFVNGANDNMKGVATLLGAGILTYRRALALATMATALGALASILFATGLIKAFSAKGLIPAEALTPSFLAAAAVGAGLTVLLATVTGMPVSTTHALVGGLAGAGFVAAGSQLNLMALGAAFLIPLVASPLLAVPLAAAGYSTGRWLRVRLGVESETCLCVGQEWIPIRGRNGAGAAVLAGFTVGYGTPQQCRERYVGAVAGVSAQGLASAAHIASAGLVSFARGFNDTPKILGLIVGASALSPQIGALAIAAAMAVGGLVAARRVAETLAKKITPMNQGQGLSGNLATSLLVVAASRFGLPVSTTHVSTGGIVGVGSVGGALRLKPLAAVVSSWIATLPLAAAIGAGAMWILA